MATSAQLAVFWENSPAVTNFILEDGVGEAKVEWGVFELACMEGRKRMVRRARQVAERLFDMDAIRRYCCEDGLPTTQLLDDLDVSVEFEASVEDRIQSIRWQRDRQELRALLEAIDAADAPPGNSPETA